MLRLKFALQQVTRKSSKDKASPGVSTPRRGCKSRPTTSATGDTPDSLKQRCVEAEATNGLRRKATVAALTISFEDLDENERSPGEAVVPRRQREAQSTEESDEGDVVLFVSPGRGRAHTSVDEAAWEEEEEEEDLNMSF